MQVLEVGQTVFLLRFLPGRPPAGDRDDGRRGRDICRARTAGRGAGPARRAEREDSELVARRLVRQRHRHPPVGRVVLRRLGARLHAFRTADDKSLRVPKDMRAIVNQVVLSPNGDRLLAADRTRHRPPALGRDDGAAGREGRVVQGAGREVLADWPGSCRTASGWLEPSRTRSASGRSPRTPSWRRGGKPGGAKQPQVSPDGRLLAAIGYGSLYFWDLTTLDQPRKISGSSNFGDSGRSRSTRTGRRWR